MIVDNISGNFFVNYNQNFKVVHHLREVEISIFFMEMQV